MSAKKILFLISQITLINLIYSQDEQFEYISYGALTDTSFRIKAKSNSVKTLNVVLNKNETIATTYSADSDGYFDIILANLKKNTNYSFDFQVNGNLLNLNKSFKTFPASNSLSANDQISFVVSSFSKTNTKKNSWDKIKALNPQFFMMLGNMYDDNVKSDSWKSNESVFLDAFKNSVSKNVYQSIPLVYMFNDESINGESSTDINDKVKNLNFAYKKMFPSYTIQSTDQNKGAYQSFQAATTRIILTDSRSFLSISGKTLFGAQQLSWLQNELTTAYADPNTKSILIALTQPWNFVKERYNMDMIQQDFTSIKSEMESDKNQIANLLKNYNFKNPSEANYKPLVMVIGERFLGFDNGMNNNFGSFPIVTCGVMDSWLQCRGGPYSHGSFHHEHDSQFCKFTLYSNKTNNNACIKVEGILAGEDTDPDQAVFTYDTCTPEIYNRKILDIKCPILWTEKILNGFITLAATVIVYLIFFVWIKKRAEKNLSYQYINDKGEVIKKD